MKDTIFDELRHEHEEMQQMMESLTQSYDSQGFKKFAEELEKHQEAEEKVLYDRVRNNSNVHDLVLEGVEEHHVATDILRKLLDQNGGTELWMARMKVLKETVEHHVEHEESEFFSAAQSVIPQQEAIEMTEEFEKEKKRVHATV